MKSKILKDEVGKIIPNIKNVVLVYDMECCDVVMFGHNFKPSYVYMDQNGHICVAFDYSEQLFFAIKQYEFYGNLYKELDGYAEFVSSSQEELNNIIGELKYASCDI